MERVTSVPKVFEEKPVDFWRRKLVQAVGLFGATAAIEKTGVLSSAVAHAVEGDENGSSYAEFTPRRGHGIERMLDHYGFPHELARGMFEDLNASKLKDGNTLYLRESYKLPLIVETLKKGQTLAGLLQSHGVPFKYVMRIHRLNKAVNIDYKKVKSPSRLRAGQKVFIPQWGAGFYVGSAEAHEEIVTEKEAAKPNVVQNILGSKWFWGNAEDDDPKEDLKQVAIDETPVAPPARAVARRPVKPVKIETGIAGMTYAQMQKDADRIKENETLKGVRFVVDPGHGGEDPGALPEIIDGTKKKRRVHEAAVVYDVSLRFMRELQKRGAAVMFTHASETRGIVNTVNPQEIRDSDYSNAGHGFVKGRPTLSGDNQAESLTTRRIIANKVKAAHPNDAVVFVSVHADSAGSTARLPMSILVDRHRDGTRKEANEQKSFATRIARHFPRRGGRKPGVSFKGLGVLRGNKADYRMLVELGNMANRADSYLLRSAEGRQRMAEILAEAFEREQKTLTGK